MTNMTSSNPEISFDAHKRIVKYLFGITLFIFIVLGTFLGVINNPADVVLTALPTVALAGVLGALLSSLNRIYSFEYTKENKFYLDKLKDDRLYLFFYSLVPSLVGAISAAVIYMGFSAGLLQGALFPVFSCSIGEGNCGDFKDFVKSWSPHDGVDYAKAIFWGVVAGFSERFVPNILDKSAAKAQENG